MRVGACNVSSIIVNQAPPTARGDSASSERRPAGRRRPSAGIGDPHRALRLAASVEALFESLGIWSSTPFWDELLAKHIGGAPGDPTFWNELLEEHIVSAREALGDQAASVWAEGRAMTLEDAVALSLTPRDS